jgi:hypothetical protein
MSTVTRTRRPINTRAAECPVVSVGTEHRDRGEPIPARTGTWPDYRSEIAAVRRPRPFSPSQAEAEATAIAERCAGDTAGESRYPYMCGAYGSLYGELYQHYLDALADAERYRRGYYPFFSDELASTES